MELFFRFYSVLKGMAICQELYLLLILEFTGASEGFSVKRDIRKYSPDLFLRNKTILVEVIKVKDEFRQVIEVFGKQYPHAIYKLNQIEEPIAFLVKDIE
jgi:hypothetical protein